MSKKLAKSLERILIIPDTHAPFHNKRSWNLMLKVAQDIKPDRIIHLGDMADFYAISFFKKNPLRIKKYRLVDEIAITNACFDDLDSLGAKYKHFISGNHEARWDRHLLEHSPELIDLPGMTIPDLFRLKSRGWSFTPYKKELRIGKIYYNHDLDKCGATAHISARGEYQSNSVIAHTHHMGLSYRGNARGEVHVGGVFGWLGDEAAIDYTHSVKARQWIQGFGVGLMEPNGVTHLQACPIIKGSVVVSGKLYR